MRKQSQMLLCGVAVMMVAVVPASYGHCGSCGHGSDAKKTATKDIVDTAVAAGNFDTLVAAVKAAGLVDTLKSDGPFTVFAPTDDAFAKLPSGTVEKLLADPDRLAAILKYHVVPGKVMAADVVKLRSAHTALGQSLDISVADGVKVGSANVVSTDIETSNGVIHVIDTVLLPKNDIVEVARSAGSFKTLLTALDAAGLTGALRGEGPFTVFAPTDEAFAKLPAGTVEGLLNDPEKLKAILTYHVVPGEVLAKDVVKLSKAGTLQGQSVKINTSNGVKVNDATVVKTDVKADNGVIHVIDSVLMPANAGHAHAGG
ncbi:MAG TPA: fasciclin domain-containing protein [Phycisphaerae bacterium]|nr:fasciclin domain-containing protein [Phycisphaerae bacterium]